jgi:hypothetical protein
MSVQNVKQNFNEKRRGYLKDKVSRMKTSSKGKYKDLYKGMCEGYQ